MSEIKVNSVVNSTGDNDSGLDLSTNDQVIIKTANTTALTVNSSQNTTLAGNLVIPDAGNIGSASDTDAIAISSSGVVNFTQLPTGAGAIGQGQTRSQPTRVFGTTYTNSTGRSIFVEVNIYHTSATQFEFRVNGSTAQLSSNSAGHWCSISSIVPNGATYLVPSATHTSKIWTELS